MADTFAGSTSGSDAPRPGKDYNSIAAALLGRVNRTGELSRDDAQDAAWCLWETTPALASHPRILAAVIHAAEQSRGPQPFRALASSYLASFAPDRPGMAEAGRSLTRMAKRMGKPWAELQRELDLFDPVKGAAGLARVCVARGDPPAKVLRSYGLGALSRQLGLVRQCVAEAMQQMRERMPQDHQRRLEWVQQFAVRNARELLFEDQGPLVANALLLPFGDNTPPSAVSDSFLRLLLRLFGDPRLHPVRWARMPEATAIIQRWLTRQSLRQFLDVVDQVADDRMWRHRRAFWDAVYDRQLISDAWVVFGQDGASTARKAFGEEISFATFDRGSVQKGHAVLLLRIGRGVVAEWSHSGKCIIWDDSDAPGAPWLHAPSYQPASLRVSRKAAAVADSAPFVISHAKSDRYHWQGVVAEKIHQMTGVRLSQAEYQVS
ncbi:MAG: EH signature domain-containing protein [Tardiphaga sp.]